MKKILIKELADLLTGKLSDKSLDVNEIAKMFIEGDLDAEALVRLSHGENMNKVYIIACEFKFKHQDFFK